MLNIAGDTAEGMLQEKPLKEAGKEATLKQISRQWGGATMNKRSNLDVVSNNIYKKQGLRK